MDMSSFQFPGNPFSGSSGPQNPMRPKRPGPLALTIIALVILGGIMISLSGFYADLLWFRSVDFVSVWSTVLTTKISLFIIFGLVTSLFISTNVYLAFRTRPIYVPVSIEADNLERYRGQLEPIRRWVLVAIAVGFFYFAGTSGMALWEPWLQFKNSTSFGIKDSQFGLDISFFVFKLPFYEALIAWAISTLILTIIAAAAVHYLYSGIRLQAAEDKTTVAARIQLSVLLGILVLIKAVAYWFDRYALELKEGRLITGLSYTDVNALLPAKAILAGISLICALLFFANIIRRSWVLPAAGLSLLVISSLLISGIYPAAIQQFQVKPSESSKEAPYIQRNIEATRAAYGLSDVTVKDYEATIATSAGQLKNDEATISNIRLLDPSVVPSTFRQLQQIKPYYNFADSLDVDRYTIDGVKRDSVVAVRELNIEGNPARNWINDHLVYTHGFGFVSAFGNTIDTDGKPTFSVGNIPPTSGLGKFEPRIYFGENVPDYSIIGGAKTSKPTELDYPDDKSANGQKNFTYTGKGGVPMGSLFTRLLFAIKYQEQRIVLSNLINSDSKILFNRNPSERVAKVAPWLTLDGNVYPAVVDGRILWIVDGYTTSNGYPYSKKTNLADATTNSITTSTTAVASLASRNVSYIRNSIKATVDAYDGTVKLYQWDTKDPVLATWSKSFPGTVTPKSAMTKSLLEHIRYPEDLFGVQRDVLSTYHVKTADAFYGGQDFWRVPTDPSSLGANAGVQPPYYMTLKLPGQEKAAFSLTTSFVPRGNRQNLTAFAVVNSDNGPDYGKISVLQLPRSTNISGPSQVASNFEAKPEVAQALSLLRQGGSDVVLGNLLTLPVGGGLLYVQPVYVRATANNSAYPLLQKVLVSFGDVIGFDNTLKGALDQVFGGNSGTVLNNTSQSTSGTTSGGNTNMSSSLKSALASAQSALADSQAALKKGDFTAYGKAQDRLKAAIAAAISAQK
ncbi:MAG: UPF0182 family protein [Actinobacteria bacterium]|uniref:Unannotated protein n=1 Tax=freshwater metagenome TaxID=449393 RepID=A0A6J6M419_9ZZZZ|nr:UPF0182 family protein [Actinomycetota bacterium]MSW21823.1 UPF0182 family protein [Actinomycetota bacterium]MSX03633.1 UPF0182 family protein [Actinomycetota bacterium]MSX83973.1 UPF0182 family protein [Actinomycetota bacterium]MSY96051.1 UPF0182 family protein [Actinomycetota bacterium]